VHERLGGHRRGQESAGGRIGERGDQKITGGGGSGQPFAFARGTVQVQQRAPHLECVGQVGATPVNGVVPKTAARQRAVGQHPARVRLRKVQRIGVPGRIVVGEHARDAFAVFAGIATFVDAGMSSYRA